jgi:leucine dehydrogenase
MKSIAALLGQWDGESIVIHPDRPTGAWIIIAIHSTRMGPATGGTRMKHYPSLEDAVQDALNLGAGMSYKFASIGFPCGGGKAVIALPAQFDAQARPDLLRRYGALVKQLGGLFQTGPDVGTSPEDMDIISETGAPHIFARTIQAGGAGDSGAPTAVGVFQAIKTVCAQLFGSDALEGRRVLVQGAGSVGGRVIAKLREAGAAVLFSDVDETAIRRFRDEQHVPFVAPDQVYETECDLFSPCALGGVLNKETIARLRCRAVVGSANNQLAEEEDALRLHQRGILYAPDFVVSFGGAMGIYGQEVLHWTQEEAHARVASAIDESLRQVFALADAEKITPNEAARRIVEKRLKG